MTETDGISAEHFRALVERSGLNLTAQEMQALKPLYDLYANQAAALHNLDLEAEEPAVTFSPNWDPSLDAWEAP